MDQMSYTATRCCECGEDEFDACMMTTINKEWWCLDCVRKSLAKAEAPRVGVGVAALIVNARGEILFGLRKGSHGSGAWALPGGRVDFGENPRHTVYREVKEETGLDVSLVAAHRECPWTNSLWQDDDKQDVTLYFTAKYLGGDPKVIEPDKCVKWHWFSADAWPEPLFGSLNDPLVRELLKRNLWRA